MDAKETVKAMSSAIEKLTWKLVAKQDELRRRESSIGTAHDVQKMNKLRDEIASIERRLSLAERVQDRALNQ